jgi:hypothetical protein
MNKYMSPIESQKVVSKFTTKERTNNNNKDLGKVVKDLIRRGSAVKRRNVYNLNEISTMDPHSKTPATSLLDSRLESQLGQVSRLNLLERAKTAKHIKLLSSSKI